MKNKIFNLLKYTMIWSCFAVNATVMASQIGIAAVVNNHMISKLQLKQRIKLAILSSNLPDVPQTYQDLGPQLLNIMIDEAIQIQLGESLGLKTQQAMLDSAMSEIEAQNNMPSGALKTVLINNNIPLDIIYSHLKANLIWRDYIRERYKENVQVSDTEINRVLDEQKAAKNALRFDLYELVINFKDNKSHAVATMNKIIDLFNKGTPFPILVKQFSNAPNADRGGHVGWVNKNALDLEQFNAIKDLQANQISRTQDNGHSLSLYFVKERLEPGQLSKPETILSFKQLLLPHNSDAFEFEIKENLNRARAIARTIKSCRVIDKLQKANHIMVQNVDNVSTQNLPSELLKILDGLIEGQASTPVLTEQGAVIFVVCKKETINPQEPTFDEIKEQLIDRKLQSIAEREMRNRRKSAHIERRTTD